MARKKNQKLPVTFLLSFVASASCGTKDKQLLPQTQEYIGNNSNPSSDSWNSYSVTSFLGLPDCNESKAGALAWVKDEKKFYSCEGSAWQTANLPTVGGQSVWSTSQLPQCSQATLGSIAWVKEEKIFYTCETIGWQKAEGDGAQSYTVSNYSGLPICNETRTGSHAWVADQKSFYTCETSGWSKADVTRRNTHSVSTVGSLPACDSAIMGNIAWVRDEKSFYTCESTGWSVTVTQPEPFEISGRWTFHTDSYNSQPDITEEATSGLGLIGNIEVVKFTNGTGYYTVSGVFLASTGNSTTTPIHDHMYNEPFSFSGIISNTDNEFVKIFKFSSFSSMRLRVKINFSSATPSFKAVVDTDGNFSDNIDKTIPLTPAN